VNLRRHTRRLLRNLVSRMINPSAAISWKRNGPKRRAQLIIKALQIFRSLTEVFGPCQRSRSIRYSSRGFVAFKWAAGKAVRAGLAAKGAYLRLANKRFEVGPREAPVTSGRMAAAAPPMRRSNCAESSYCALIHPRKGLTSNNEAGQRCRNGVVKRQKAQSLVSKPPT
jgi:hypothetical protein